MIPQVDSLLHLLILMTMPLVVTYATINVAIAVYLRCKTWPVAAKGWGSAIILIGYVLFNYDHGSLSSAILALAVIMTGLSFVVWPFIWSVAKQVSDTRA